MMIRSYIQHLFKSNTRHGTHSPFVYEFLEKVLYDRTLYQDYKKLDELILKLRSDDRALSFQDPGAGSKGSQKRVSDIAKRASASKNQSRLLYRIAKYYKPENILELGTNLGVGAASIMLGNPSAKLTTIEGVSNLRQLALENFEELKIEGINSIEGNFDEVLEAYLSTAPKFDLVYMDGNHRYEPTLRYFDLISNKLHNDSWVILDDIHWSTEMEKAWTEITSREEVKVSIDLFRSGILLFRKEMTKEDFVIRF